MNVLWESAFNYQKKYFLLSAQGQVVLALTSMEWRSFPGYSYTDGVALGAPLYMEVF